MLQRPRVQNAVQNFPNHFRPVATLLVHIDEFLEHSSFQHILLGRTDIIINKKSMLISLPNLSLLSDLLDVTSISKITHKYPTPK